MHHPCWAVLKFLGSKETHHSFLGYCMCLCAQLYPTPCNSMTVACQTPLVHGISHARMPEWLAISFSRGSSWPRNRIRMSCIGRWIFFIFFFLTTAPPGKPWLLHICIKIRKDIRPPWWVSGKESACQGRRYGFIPVLGWSPGEGNGNPLQYSCLRNLMDRGAWWATVHGTTKSWIWSRDGTHVRRTRNWALGFWIPEPYCGKLFQKAEEILAVCPSCAADYFCPCSSLCLHFPFPLFYSLVAFLCFFCLMVSV